MVGHIMKKQKSFDMEIDSSIDVSLLQMPLTPFTDFKEAKSVFEKGSAEVRHLLLHECSLIYECKICRNMFRSLANFINHKRKFCFKSTLERNDSHDTTNCTETRKSSSAYEYFPPKNSTELHQKYAQVQSFETSDAAAAAKKTRCLNIEKNLEDNRAEQEANLLAGIKNKHSNDLNETSNKRNVDQETPNQSKPSYVFQCPSCPLTFFKSASIVRHLASAHNVPMRLIRTMRDTLKKRPAKSVSLNCDALQRERERTKPSRDLKNFQIAAAADLVTTTATVPVGDERILNNKSIDKDLTKCIFCQKSFDRRATLSAHLQTCHIKLEMMEEPTATTPPLLSSVNKRMVGLQLNANSIITKNQTTAAIAADVDCELNEEDDVKRTFAHLEQQDFGIGLQTVSLEKLDISGGESTNASLAIEKEIDAELYSTVLENVTTKQEEEGLKITVGEDSLINDSNLESSVVLSSPSSGYKKRKIRTNCAAKQSCQCKICNKQFDALSNLRRHISMFHYRAGKFGCALCDYCAFRRYDIINHLGHQHKMDAEDNAETAKYVVVNDVFYTKDDMDGDIVILGPSENHKYDNDGDENRSTNNCEHKTNEKAVRTVEKRRRRRNKSLISQFDKQFEAKKPRQIQDDLDSTGEIKLTRQMLKRSLAQSSAEIMHSSTKVNQKRPTRNRVKPVNKDFVYDLNDTLKKEQAQLAGTSAVDTETYHLRGSKRRNTLNTVQLELKQPIVPAFEYIKPKNFALIKGVARRTILHLVNMGLAASSTLPDIPTARPQMRSRVSFTQRSDIQAGTVIESAELDAASLKSLPLCDDSYLEKIAKESVGSFQMRPRLAQQHSALDTLLQKVDSSKNFLNGSNVRMTVASSTPIRIEINEVAAQTNCLDAATADENITNNKVGSPCYVTPEQSILKAFVTPSKPQKRLPSLDRLAETINSSMNDYNASLLEQ